MSIPVKKILSAARARAAGQSWQQTADTIGRPVQVVREWPDRFPTEWKRCFQQAQREIQDEAEAEAVAKLRSQLRAKQPDAGTAAAKSILGWVKKPSPKSVDLACNDDELARRHVEALSVEQHDELMSLLSEPEDSGEI